MTARHEPRRNADGVPVMQNGQPNPTGTGRYCPPAVCYCGGCSWWRPAPTPNYDAARAALAERVASKRRRR